MTKLIYPVNGIYPNCRDDIQGCTKKLSKAVANCNFDIPSDFPYKNYLRNLDNKLNKCLAEIDSISSKLKRTDSSFNMLSDNLTADASRITPIKVAKRDRMIV